MTDNGGTRAAHIMDPEPGWRNVVMRRVALAHGLPIVRAYAAMAPLHALHRSGECTHWCYHREVFAPVVEGVWRALLAR